MMLIYFHVSTLASPASCKLGVICNASAAVQRSLNTRRVIGLMNFRWRKINYVYGKIKYHNKKNCISQFFIVKVDRSDDYCGYSKFLLVGFARILNDRFTVKICLSTAYNNTYTLRAAVLAVEGSQAAALGFHFRSIKAFGIVFLNLL